MARPVKDGVDYFPKDTDFYSDDKVRLLRAEFGAKGMYVLDYLLCEIYGKNGYFVKWDRCRCFLVSDGAGCGCSPSYIQEVVAGCIRCSLFDKRVFDVFGVLTSAGIQRRYIRMFNGRDQIPIFLEYWLLDNENRKDVPASVLGKIYFQSLKSTENPDKSTENPDKSTENAQNKTEENKTNIESAASSAFSSIVGSYEATFGRLIGGRDQMILREITAIYDAQLIMAAIKIAKNNNAGSAAYVRSILNRWKSDGINTIADLKTKTNNQRSQVLPDYSDASRYADIEEGE